MKQQERQRPRPWARWALLLGAFALVLFLASRFFSGSSNSNGERPATASASHAGAPTVLCADGTRSDILTRAAQEDACAAHGGIRKLLVPPYLPAQPSKFSGKPEAEKPKPTSAKSTSAKPAAPPARVYNAGTPAPSGRVSTP